MVIIDNKVYFDTDCLSGFLIEKEMGSLFMLFKNNIVIPDAVYRELINYPPFKAEIEQYVQNKAITVEREKATTNSTTVIPFLFMISSLNYFLYILFELIPKRQLNI